MHSVEDPTKGRGRRPRPYHTKVEDIRVAEDAINAAVIATFVRYEGFKPKPLGWWVEYMVYEAKEVLFCAVPDSRRDVESVYQGKLIYLERFESTNWPRKMLFSLSRDGQPWKVPEFVDVPCSERDADRWQEYGGQEGRGKTFTRRYYQRDV